MENQPGQYDEDTVAPIHGPLAWLGIDGFYTEPLGDMQWPERADAIKALEVQEALGWAESV